MKKRTCNGCAALMLSQYEHQCMLQYPIEEIRHSDWSDLRPAAECPKPRTIKEYVRLSLERNQHAQPRHETDWAAVADKIAAAVAKYDAPPTVEGLTPEGVSLLVQHLTKHRSGTPAQYLAAVYGITAEQAEAVVAIWKETATQ